MSIVATKLRLTGAGLIALTVSLVAGCEGEPSLSAEDLRTKDGCDPDRVTETDGHRRLALIVGVGEYLNRVVPDLSGPPGDAERIYALLTGPDGYGFPKLNVCLLLDGEATTANFKQAFDQALVSRARKGDVAVFYFAGHGSEIEDTNGDEPDGWDESLMLHDARTDMARDLLDDELNRMLARLSEKTRDVTVILDSCNSGTATRGPEEGTVAARFVPPPVDAEADGAPITDQGRGAGAPGWIPESLDGLVAFSAASDSNPALERDGRGIFTDALLRIMSQVGARPLTLAQVARQTPPLMAAESTQIPYFQGDLDRPVFGNRGRNRPIAWEIIETGPPIELGGPPLPGIGAGAELRVYDGAATGAETRDPGQAKATVVIDDDPTGLNAKARVSAIGPRSGGPERGDLAVLVRPADAFIVLKVRLRPAGEPGGIPDERAVELRRIVEADPEAAMLVSLTEGQGDFELSVGPGGQLLLRGPAHRVRNVIESDRRTPRMLWQHARQRALLHLRGEGGSELTDQETLLARLVPAAARPGQCVRGAWEQAAPNTEQVIPLCQTWNLEIELAEQAPVPLLVGALILSTDGSVFALPSDDRKVRLRPGETYRFEARGETFRGEPPLVVRDRVLVFGTQETNPVSWKLFTETAQTRAAGPRRTGLAAALHRYLTPGTRATVRVEEAPAEDTTWTMSYVTMRVEANQGLPASDGAGVIALENACDASKGCGGPERRQPGSVPTSPTTH